MGDFLEGYGSNYHADHSCGYHYDGYQRFKAFRYRLRDDRRQFWNQCDSQPHVHGDVQKLQRGPRHGCGGYPCARHYSLYLLQYQTLSGTGGNPMNRDKINQILGKIPTHLIIIFTILIWVVPTLGLLITSIRPVQDVNSTGWWTVFSAQNAGGSYVQYCVSCHGEDGKAIPEADLSDPNLSAKYPRSIQLLAILRQDINGKP